MIESIEWSNLVPRQRIDDSFEIHLLHWGLCGLLSSIHQFCLPEVLVRQFALRKESCDLGSLADHTILVFWELTINTVLPGCHFRRTFRIWVLRNVCGCWHFCIHEIIWELLESLQEISQAVSRCLLVVLILILALGFRWIGPLHLHTFASS